MSLNDKIRDRLLIGSGGGGGKDGEGGGHTPVEDPDSLRSEAFARIIDLISEGEIGGLVNGAKSIFLNDTPLQNANGTLNFSNFNYITRTGTQAQTAIPGFPAAESANNVGLEITKIVPVVQTVNDLTANYIQVVLGFPALYSQDLSTGDVHGTSVQLQILVQTNGGGFVPFNVGQDYIAGTVNTATTGNVPATTSIRGTFHFDGYHGDIAVQTSPHGAGTWTTRQTITLGELLTGEGGGFYLKISQDQNFQIDGLASAAYDVRLLLTFDPVDNPADPVITLSALKYLGPSPTITVSGKATSRYQKTFRIPLSGSPPWDIKVVRVTDDSTSGALNNKTFWDAYTVGTNAKFTYPNSALIGISIDAKQFASIPRRGYLIKGVLIKVPTNYDPIARTYTGMWDGTFKVAWSNNPAWVWYDMVTNTRYGLGNYIDATQVDKWSLYTIGQYCDELVPNGFGGTEPRFTCNAYIQSQLDAIQLVQSLASVFRGITYWAAGQLVPVQDSPASALHIFNPTNVRNGVFSYAGSAKNTRHTVAIVAWNDPADHYRAKYEYVPDNVGIARYGLNTTQVTAVGATSRGQAHRAGKWLLYTERMETDTVTFQTALEGNSVRPGHLMKIHDPVRAAKRLGGRLIAATTTQITVDAPVVIEPGKSYTIDVKLDDGTIASKSITNAAGTYTVLNLASALASAPSAYSNWLITVNDLSPQLFKAISVTIKDDVWVEIVGVSSNQSKYAAIETGVTLQPLQISSIQLTPSPPTNIVISDHIARKLSGDIDTWLDISWTAPADSTVGLKYRIEIKKDDANWMPISQGDTTNTFVSIPGVIDGSVYGVRVRSVNSLSNVSASWLVGEWKVVGKTAPPSDPLVCFVQNAAGGVVFGCNEIEDPDLDRVEVRLLDLGDTDWNNGIPKANILRGQTHTTASVPPGSWTFLFASFDTTGHRCANPFRVDTVITAEGYTTIRSQSEAPYWLGFFPNYTALLAAADCVQTPDTAAVSITGDIDIVAHIQPDDWTPAAQQSIASKWDTTGNQRSWFFGLESNGKLSFNYSTDGANAFSVSSSVATGIASGDRWVRCTVDVNNGAAGFDTKFYTSTDGVVWTQLGTTVTTGGTISLFDSTAPLVAGALGPSGISSEALLGRLLSLSLYNGIGGTLVANFDAEYAGDGDTALTSRTTGEAWSFNGTAAVVSTNFVLHSNGTLVPKGMAAAGSFSDNAWIDFFVPDPYRFCTYTATEIDKGIDGTVRIYVDSVAALGPGETSGNGNPSNYIDYHTVAGAYDGFEPWIIGSINFRYEKSRLILDTDVGVAMVTDFTTTIDSLARVEEVHGITIGAGGTPVTFENAYHTIPGMLNPSISAYSDDSTPKIPTHTGDSATGTTLHLYNTSGVEVGGTGGYRASGV